MACKMKRVTGEPDVHMEGHAGSDVTLLAVADTGSVRFMSASYDKRQLITAASEKISFRLKEGVRDLAVVFTFSSNDARGELQEDCDGKTVLDDTISAINNGKLYGVRGLDSATEGLEIAASQPRKRKRAQSKRRKENK